MSDVRAHDAVYQAKRKGLLVPQPCVKCGAKKVHAHHESYSRRQWLNVVWFCQKHHAERHRELKAISSAA